MLLLLLLLKAAPYVLAMLAALLSLYLISFPPAAGPKCELCGLANASCQLDGHTIELESMCMGYVAAGQIKRPGLASSSHCVGGHWH